MARQRIVLHNPTAGVELPRAEKRLPRHTLSLRQVEAVLAQVDVRRPLGVRDRAMLETLYSTAVRRAELVGLERSDVDRERGLVLIRCGKGKKDRFVPIGRRALGWIDRYVAEVRPALAGGASTGALFLSSTSGRIHPNYFSWRVKRYFRAAGIDYPGACHLFRHSAATLMLENGADIRYLQALLGHESLRTTQVYTHVSIAKLCEVHRRTHPARLSRLDSDRFADEDDPDAASA